MAGLAYFLGPIRWLFGSVNKFDSFTGHRPNIYCCNICMYDVLLIMSTPFLIEVPVSSQENEYHVFVCWGEMVYNVFNFLTPTVFTLSIEVLLAGQTSPYGRKFNTTAFANLHINNVKSKHYTVKKFNKKNVKSGWLTT
jgi:hypothetical protein